MTGHPGYRPALLSASAERASAWEIRLPAFVHHSQGWTGSVAEFLSQVRNGTLSLRHVPLATVIDQYVSYIHTLDLEQAGEFLDVTASLIYYKSSLLLPRNSWDQEDLRWSVLQQIGAGEKKRQEQKRFYANAPDENKMQERSGELSLLDLFLLLNQVQQSLAADPTYQVEYPAVNVSDQVQWLKGWFFQHVEEESSFYLLCDLHSSQQAKLCLFLALLEMVKSGQLRLEQKTAFEELTIYRSGCK